MSIILTETLTIHKFNPDNPYWPYPKWFGDKYGTNLEGVKDDYLRNQCLHNIQMYKSKYATLKERHCDNCKADYWQNINEPKKECPFCKAPNGYNIKKMNWFM